MFEHCEVTIGIPVYRSEDYIGKTMESVLCQTFPDIEFLIVDDCGGDGSMQVIRNLQQTHPRGDAIRILTNNRNQGVSYSRNRIISEAQGRFIYFLDSDDLIEPDTIQKLYDAAIIHQSQVACAAYDIVNSNSSESPRIYRQASMVFEGADALASYAYKYNKVFQVSACNALIDLSFLRQTGIRFINAAYWEDMAFTTELVTKVSRAVLIPDVTYHYVRRSGSLSNYQGREDISKREVMANVSVLDYLKTFCKTVSCNPYLPDLCFNLEMNSFYTACHILRKRHHIMPRFTTQEMRQILRHPFPLSSILRFPHKRTSNLVFWFLGIVPTFLFVPLLWILGKIKRAV